MSIENNIGSTPGSGHSSLRRNTGSTSETGRSAEPAKPAADGARVREARQTPASTTVDDVQKLPEGTRIEARIVSVALADQQLQKNLQLRNQQAALLALRLQLTNQPIKGAGPREGATLTTTISAGALSAALADSSGSRAISTDTTRSDTSVLQRLKQAVSTQPFLQLRVSGGRLELLSAAALPASTQALAEVTLQSQQQSLAKWMPLQADTKASLRALLDLAGVTGKSSMTPPGQDVPPDGAQFTELAGKLGKALASVTPPPVSLVRTQGFLQQHMQGSGLFMESKLAAALSLASSAGQDAKSSQIMQPGSSNPLRNFAMALKNALGGPGGESGKAAANPLDSRMQADPLQPAGRVGDAPRHATGPSSTGANSGNALLSLPPSDLKSAVMEALGLVLKLQNRGPAGTEAREGHPGAGSSNAPPQNAAQLVRLLRAEMLKTLENPTRLANLSPDAQEQAAVSMISRAALNINKDESDRDTGELLKHLARLLARVQTNQLTSIQGSQQASAEQPGSQTLVLDLPFLHHQAEMVTVLMERYPSSGQQNSGTEDKRYGYRIVLDFNFDKSERITALKSHVRYTEGTVSAAFWTGSEDEARIIATHLPQLRQELTRWGLVVGELSLQVGEAPPARQGVRKQILNERI